MADKVESVYNCLCDVFSIPKKQRQRKPKTRYEHKGRIIIVSHVGHKQWEGYYEDNHSTMFMAETKKQLKIDMGIDQ